MVWDFGDLCFGESVVGEIVVESVDDPVAITPGVRERGVGTGGELAVGVAGEVEPMAGPALTVMGAGEKAVNGVGLIGACGEGVGLFGSGRKTGEAKGDAAEPCARIGWFGGDKFGCFQLGGDEAINGFVCGGLYWLKRPEGFLFWGDFGNGRLDLFLHFRPGKTSTDPVLEAGDFVLRKGADRGHFEAHMGSFDGFDEEAGFGFAFDDDFAGLAAFEETFAGIEAQVSQGAAGVAGVTVRGEEGADLRFEEFVAVGGEERKGASGQRHEKA